MKNIRSTTELSAFPHLDWCANELGISAEALVTIFVLEQAFHNRMLATESAEERGRQYHDLYSKVHSILLAAAQGTSEKQTLQKCTRLVLTFRRELEGKSVLDIGCGNGLFLTELARLIPHGQLCGIDTSGELLPQGHAVIQFVQENVIDFNLGRRFDVVYSHQVLEHIAPADLPSHLESVRSVLAPDGEFILILPNRYWGPQDITRIVDNSFSGRVAAQGSHLNESSYTELIPQLEMFGFTNIRTVLPFAMFIPGLRGVRVRPSVNRLIERHPALRALINRIRVHGRPLFKNPIVLICQKA